MTLALLTDPRPHERITIKAGTYGAKPSVRDVRVRVREDLRPVIEALAAEGVTTLSGIARAFNARGLLTPRGGRWHASTVRNLLTRTETT